MFFLVEKDLVAKVRIFFEIAKGCPKLCADFFCDFSEKLKSATPEHTFLSFSYSLKFFSFSFFI